jgi:hypothetical protein
VMIHLSTPTCKKCRGISDQFGWHTENTSREPYKAKAVGASMRSFAAARS